METIAPDRRGTRRAWAMLAIAAVLGVGGAAYVLRGPAGPVSPGPGAPIPVPPTSAPVAAAPAVSAPVVSAPTRSAAAVPAAAPVVPPVSAPVATPVAPAAPAAPAPSFDVVRVGPQGSAVIAGRAEPGAEVVVRDGTQEIARTQADRGGAFVAIPAAPLPEGGRSLTLAARGPDAAERRSEAAVVVVVPPQPAVPSPDPAPTSAPGPVAVLVPDAGAPRVLQAARAPSGAVGLDTVDYDDKGAIRFMGHAAASSAMRVYVDNAPVGDAGTDAGGRWVLTPGQAISPGVHTLRVDRLDDAGRVTARVEMPFQRAAVPAAELSSGRMVVQPGQSLWRMAHAAYGSGVRYTVIYLANKDMIRDPRLIYPGQAFSVPAP